MQGFSRDVPATMMALRAHARGGPEVLADRAETHDPVVTLNPLTSKVWPPFIAMWLRFGANFTRVRIQRAAEPGRFGTEGLRVAASSAG